MATEKAFRGKIEPEEVNYVPLSTVKGKACSNCRWFIADAPADCACYLVEAETDEGDEPILATGYCDRWEAPPVAPEDPAEMMAEAIVEAITNSTDTISEAVYSNAPMPMGMDKALEQPGVIERLLTAIKAVVKPEKQASDLQVFKGKDGKTYWLASFTNNFKDREDEILSEQAHKDFEARLEMKLAPMPELWAWHTNGTRHGKAVAVWYQDHNMFAIGEFDDTPVAQKAIAYYRKYPVKLSHGFVAPTWAFKNGIYDAYNTFEISTLLPSVAANPYTSFEEIKAMPTPINREAFIKELFGDKAPDVLAKVNALSTGSKELETMVEFKDFSKVTPTTPTTPSDREKSLSELVVEMIDGQNQMIGFVKAQAMELKAKDETITALKSEKDSQIAQLSADIKALQTLVNAPPSRASQSASTRIDPENTTLKDVTPKAPDTFFGDLYMQPNGAKS